MAAFKEEEPQPVLFGLDAHGIQKYLFATSKLREIVGASHLVGSLTDQWVSESLKRLSIGQYVLGASEWYEPVRLGGGSVRLVLSQAELAKQLLHTIRRRALETAPGMLFDAAWVPYDTQGGDLADVNRLLIEKINAARNHPGAGAAFKGFPISAPCRLTFDPASGFGEEVNERLCEVSLSKRLAQSRGRSVWRDFVSGHPLVERYADADEPFESELGRMAGKEAENGYVAVVCVDLNDLGERGREATAGNYGLAAAQEFHRFTEAVKTATRQAFHAGLAAIENNRMAIAVVENNLPSRQLPLRPLVIGGDDMTFVMDARLAAPFLLGLMRSFEQNGFRGGGGIAFVKAKAPFGRTVDLAEQLVASSKAKGRGVSHVDFLACAGEVPADIKACRSQGPDGCRLTAGPWSLDDFEVLVGKAKTLARLPRTHIRGAADRCHEGREEGQRAFENLKENLARGLGGRPDTNNGRPFTQTELSELYPDGFFQTKDSGTETDLLDCIALFRFVADSGAFKQDRQVKAHV